MTLKRVDATVKTIGDDSDFPGEFEVILSAPTVDRDNEVVTAGAFTAGGRRLPDHITFDVDHGLSVDKTVGSGRPFYDGDLLKVQGTFARTPLAQTVRSLVADGHIRTTSVAMRNPKKEVKDGVGHIVSAELLNGSFVSIPSCREALVLSAKAGARNSATDAATIQGIHDEAVKLGATCAGGAADPSGETSARGYGDSIREQALRLLEGTTTKGAAPMGQQDDELWLRAKRLELKARIAILNSDLAEAKRAERPSSWDATIVRRKGVSMARSMADLLDEAQAAARSAPTGRSVKGAGFATLDPGQPPVRCSYVPEPEERSPEQLPPDQMVPVLFDHEHPVTIYDPDNLAVESVMGGFTESRYLGEADE